MIPEHRKQLRAHDKWRKYSEAQWALQWAKLRQLQLEKEQLHTALSAERRKKGFWSWLRG